MKIEALHIGMKVRHPQYGVGEVKTISEATAEIHFNEGRRTVAPEPSGLEPAEAQASIRGLEVPLAQVVQQAVEATIQRLGLEKPESVVELLGVRWHKGRAVEATIQRLGLKKITWWQAAEILGISDRHMRRIRERYEEEGYNGLLDRRRGQPSRRRVPVATVEKVFALDRE